MAVRTEVAAVLLLRRAGCFVGRCCQSSSVETWEEVEVGVISSSLCNQCVGGAATRVALASHSR